MKRDILLSIHKRHADNIFAGLKTLEIRKTAPLGVDYPYIIYMYETKANNGAGAIVGCCTCEAAIKTNVYNSSIGSPREFDTIDEKNTYIEDISKRACLTKRELLDYAYGHTIYGLVIREVKRFENPRPLSDFGITFAPQSWQYITKIKKEGQL